MLGDAAVWALQEAHWNSRIFHILLQEITMTVDNLPQTSPMSAIIENIATVIK